MVIFTVTVTTRLTLECWWFCCWPWRLIEVVSWQQSGLRTPFWAYSNLLFVSNCQGHQVQHIDVQFWVKDDPCYQCIGLKKFWTLCYIHSTGDTPGASLGPDCACPVPQQNIWVTLLQAVLPEWEHSKLKITMIVSLGFLAWLLTGKPCPARL